MVTGQTLYIQRIRISLLCLWVGSTFVTASCAQTPWEAAPARPAQLPPKVEPSPKRELLPAERPQGIASLPSPPPKQSLGGAVLSRPESVAIKTQPESGAELLLPLPATPTPVQTTNQRGAMQSGTQPLMPQLPFPSAAAGGSGPKLSLPKFPSSSGPTNTTTALIPGGSAASMRTTSFAKPTASVAQPPMVGAVQNLTAELDVKKLESGTLVAVVGEDPILAGDLSAYVEPVIDQYRSQFRKPSDEDIAREQIIRQVLKSYIEVKALYQEFFRDASGGATPDKMEDMKRNVTTRAGKIFFEKQVPTMLKSYDVKDMQELEVKLNEKAMSLTSMRSTFIEQVLGSELERKYVPEKYEISRDELLRYYQENQEKWEEPAQAKWQQLTIRFDRHEGDRDVVERKIKELGNKVFLGGQSFESVAKQASEGWTAAEGGNHDWTSKGSLKSKELDEALFSLPPNRLSQVITDSSGMHIIRVLERTPQRRKPFTEAQKEIRESLSNERKEKVATEFRKKILARTSVWSLWPDDLKEKVPHVRALDEATGKSN